MLKKVIGSQTFKDVVVVLMGNGLSVILGFVFVILTARRLGPSEFGIFSTILAYSIFISAVSDLGVNQSIVKFFHNTRDEKQRRSWLSTGFASVVLSSTVISLVASVVYHFFLRSIWHHGNSQYWAALFAMNILIAINTYLLSYFQTLQQFIHRALIDNLFSVARIVMTLYVLSLGYFTVAAGLWIIVWAYFVAIVVALIAAKKWIVLSSVDISKAPQLLKFGKWLAANSIFSNLYGKLDVMMLAWLVSAYHTGLYSAASRFITIFPLVVSSLSSVVAPRFAQYQQVEEARAYIIKMFTLAVAISIGMLSLVVLGRFIILTAYTSEFAPAVPMFRLLVVAYLPLLLSVPAGNALVYFFKKPQIITWVSLTQLIGLAALNYVLVRTYGAYGVIVSLVAMNLFGMLAQYYFLTKKLKI